MEPSSPEVYDPWWDIRSNDDSTDDLEWTPARSDIPVVRWANGERHVIGTGSYDPKTGELTAIIDDEIFQNMTSATNINTFSIEEND